MTSRERVSAALDHQEPDRVPVDFGGTVVTCIHASALNRLRKALHLEERPIKVYEPMMMLGTVEQDIADALSSDVVGLYGTGTLLGYKNEDWKKWTTPDGTDVLMGGGFEYTVDSNGVTYAYPQGDLSARPSVRMPAGGLYFDSIIRQEDLCNHNFDARKDYADMYSVFTDEECLHYEKNAKSLYEETDCAVFGNFFLGNMGDIFHIPGPWLKDPKGIRDLEEWIMAAHFHPDYVKDFFEMHTEISLENLKLYHQAVGERISVVAISGTDFGGQHGLLISPDTYREFYKPFHKRFNDWVHENTSWKTFFHTCGAVTDLLEDFIEAGVDVINPVQVSARGMDAVSIKKKFGDRIVFWGGGVDPQKTMSFGTPEEVAEETKRNVTILSRGGGFVCGTVHNIQGPTPVENILAFFNSINL
jgi:hypothetical protein